MAESHFLSSPRFQHITPPHGGGNISCDIRMQILTLKGCLSKVFISAILNHIVQVLRTVTTLSRTLIRPSLFGDELTAKVKQANYWKADVPALPSLLHES